MATLGGLTLLLATPVGFIVSLVGVLLNRGRRAGVVGLILTGGIAGYYLLVQPVLYVPDC